MCSRERNVKAQRQSALGGCVNATHSALHFEDAPHRAVTCPTNPDSVPMRVPMGHGLALETLDDEADEAYTGTDREQAA